MPDGDELVTNGDFSAWTGVPLNDTPDSYIVIGQDGTNNYVTEVATGCHMVSDGTLVGLRQDICTIGEVYKVTLDIASLTSGGLNIYNGGVLVAGPFTTAAVHTSYIVASSSAQLIVYRNFASNLVIRSFSVERVITGRNLVQNPYFDTDTIWNKGTGWTIGSGKATHAPGNTANLAQLGLPNLYGVEVEYILKVSGMTAGNVRLQITATTVITITANGIYKGRFTGINILPTNIYLPPTTDFDGSIEFVEIRPVSSATNGRYCRNIALNPWFANWTGDNPDNWTVVEVGDATSNITENPAGHCQIISNGTNVSLQQAVLDIGKIYVVTIHVATAALGSIKTIGLVGDVVISTVGVHKIVSVADSTTLVLSRNVACNITIDSVRVEQILIQPSSAFPSDELLTNNNFSLWSPNPTGWSTIETVPADQISEVGSGEGFGGTGSGSCNFRRSATGIVQISQNIMTTGSRYYCHGHVSYDGGGSLVCFAEGVTIANITDAGDFDFIFTTTGDTFSMAAAVGTDMTSDYVSLVEINPLNMDLTAVTIGEFSSPGVGRMMGLNGTTSFGNMYSAELNSMLPPDVGTVSVVSKFSTAVWADGSNRDMLVLSAGANNQLYFRKRSSANELLLVKVSGGGTETHTITAGQITPLLTSMAYDYPGDLITYLLNGTTQGTDNGLLPFVGNLTSSAAVVGASSTAPALVTSGNLAHFILYDAAKTPAEQLTLAQLMGLA